MISPSASVTASAPAKLRHGDVRLHGFRSLPLAAETKVRGDAKAFVQRIALRRIGMIFMVIVQRTSR